MDHARSHPARRRALFAIVIGGVGAAGVLSLAGDAEASRVDTAPTIVLASGEAPPALPASVLVPLRSAVETAWPSATVESGHEVVDDQVSYVSLAGGLGADSYEATIYRRFEAAELEEFGAERLATPAGDAWVGTTDDDLTSVYFRSNAGVGVWVGVTPQRGSKPMPVDVVLERAISLAAAPAAQAVVRGYAAAE